MDQNQENGINLGFAHFGFVCPKIGPPDFFRARNQKNPMIGNMRT